MNVLRIGVSGLSRVNEWTGRIGTVVSAVALGLMVLVILIQVFFRYILNNALPWPDEAARFLMLWLTGLMAPVALRQGSMVAISGLIECLPPSIVRFISLCLLCVCLMVLCVAVQLGWMHVQSGWLFSSSSLKLPLSLIGGESVKIKLAWMYMSLFVGVCLMILVACELLLRMVMEIFGGEPPVVAEKQPSQMI